MAVRGGSSISWRQFKQITYKRFVVAEDCICIYKFVFVFVFLFCICICIALYLQCIDDGYLIMNGDRLKILTGDFRESSRA